MARSALDRVKKIPGEFEYLLLTAASRLGEDGAIRAGDPIYVPTICLVELTYLVEKGRVEASALERLKKAC